MKLRGISDYFFIFISINNFISPKTWLLVDDLPRTLTGKVRRDLLADRTDA